jgi:hypothetical protein
MTTSTTRIERRTGRAGAVARDIGGRLGVEPAAIVEAVEDALAGRRPRW